MAKKIEIIEDEDAQKKWPLEQLVKINVYLKDGSTIKAVSHNPHFLDNQEVLDKCKYYLEPILRKGACEEFIESVMEIEKVNDIKKISNIISERLKK